MTKSYAQLQSAIAKLEREAAAIRQAETTKVVAQIKESIATFGLTVEHLFGRSAKALKAATGKAIGGGRAVRKGAGVPKYRDPKTGKTWTGFGKAPGWIATVRNRSKFLIDQSGVVAAPSREELVTPVAAVAKAEGKARNVAAPVKTSIRSKKVASASDAIPGTKAEKAAAKKSAPSKKAESAKKAAATRKATKAPKTAAKAIKNVAAKATKAQAVVKTRRSRASKLAVAPILTSTPAETPASAS